MKKVFTLLSISLVLLTSCSTLKKHSSALYADDIVELETTESVEIPDSVVIEKIVILSYEDTKFEKTTKYPVNGTVKQSLFNVMLKPSPPLEYEWRTYNNGETVAYTNYINSTTKCQIDVEITFRDKKCTIINVTKYDNNSKPVKTYEFYIRS